VGTGFYFGNIPLIKDNLTLVALAIVAVSVLPVLWRLMRASK
jgi:membrane-associated protein